MLRSLLRVLKNLLKPTNVENPELYIMPIKKVSREEARRLYPKKTKGGKR